MYVIATAGHVDHGKSTLVQALTGSDPDRLAEERARGLTIELGFVWTQLPTGQQVAFVDVPGHERFISTMLAGVGPVPAVLFIVAADDPWMPQATEHLAALQALGVERAVVAVTRSDLADPTPRVTEAHNRLAETPLAGSPVVPVSAITGLGLDELRTELANMLDRLTPPDARQPVRLWIDRHFTIKGSGLVVTGTLPDGHLRVGQTLIHNGTTPARIRAIQSLEQSVGEVSGIARVALNLSGLDSDGVHRGDVLTTPEDWQLTSVVDVRLTSSGDRSETEASQLPEQPILHIGATSRAVHARPIDNIHLRLSLDEPLPLRIGDRAVLRDPGTRTVWGVLVLDPAPRKFTRRTDRTRRAAQLTAMELPATLEAEVERRGIVELALLRRVGVPIPADAGLGENVWLMSEVAQADARTRLEKLVADHHKAAPLSAGISARAAADQLGLPSPALLAQLVRPPLRLDRGQLSIAERPQLPEAVEKAIAELSAGLADSPFNAPDADRLRELGLDQRALAAAERAGLLVRVSPTIVLLPDVVEQARTRLAELPDAFTLSQARQALETTRRVAVPLLEYLDKVGVTRRVDSDRRALVRK